MWSDWLVFCDCGFHPDCPLLEKVKRLMEASWWEILTEGLTGSCSDRVMSPLLLLLKDICKNVKPLSQHNIISLNLQDRAACVKGGYCGRRVDKSIFGCLGHHFNYWCSICICFISKVPNYILNTFTVKDYLNTIALKNFYLFYFLLCWVFIASWASSSCSEQELLSGCGEQASHCSGLSCCRARAPGTWASVVAAYGLIVVTMGLSVSHT